MKFFIFLLCAALFVFLVVRGAVLLIKDLFNGEFSYEGSGYKPPNDESCDHLEVGQVGISMDAGVFCTGPSSELKGGSRGFYSRTD